MSVEAVRPSPYPPEFTPLVTVGMVGKQIGVFRHNNVDHAGAIYLLEVGKALLLDENIHGPKQQQAIVPASADVLRQLKG